MNRIMLRLFGLGVLPGLFCLSGAAHAVVDDHQITITTTADVTNKRQALIDFIWGAHGFPSNKMPQVTRNVESPVGGLNNLLRVDRLFIPMDAWEYGLAYHFVPQRQNSELVVVHHGHACSFQDDTAFDDGGYGMQRTINGLLTDGYSVLAVFMPHWNPIECGSVSHDTLFSNPEYQPSSGSPMQYFLEPVAVSLNYLKTRSAADDFPLYQDFHMVGLSGGGWTATVYAAIDPTIRFSIPVAGTMPLSNRAGPSIGDIEQYLDDFYEIAGYPDLYVLGSYGQGRKQVWLLNRHDDCCFGERTDLYQDPLGRTWEQVVRDYEADVRTTLFNLGAVGSFRLEIDEAAPAHMISWNAVANQILSELNGGRSYIGASSGAHAFVRGLDGLLWHKGPGGPQDWEYTGCPVAGVPAAVEGAVNSLDVFYRDEGNRLMHAFTNGTGWTCEPAGGVIISDPAVVSSDAGSYDVVAFGADYQLYRWHGMGAGVGPFELVNGAVRGLGTPSLVARGPHQLDVFFRGFDRSLYHIASSGPLPWPVETLGGVMLDFPSAAGVATSGSLAAYVRGQSSRLWEVSQVNGGPWQWASISDRVGGQVIAGSPSASVHGSAVRVRARQPSDNLASFGAFGYTNNGCCISGSPTSTPEGTWARGPDGNLWSNRGLQWFELGGLFD
jgi:hypothetical protein